MQRSALYVHRRFLLRPLVAGGLLFDSTPSVSSSATAGAASSSSFSLVCAALLLSASAACAVPGLTDVGLSYSSGLNGR